MEKFPCNTEILTVMLAKASETKNKQKSKTLYLEFSRTITVPRCKKKRSYLSISVWSIYLSQSDLSIYLSIYLSLIYLSIYLSIYEVRSINKGNLVVVSILLYGYTTCTLTKRMEKKLDRNYTRMLQAILNNSWR